jgi:hypothetical protein
LVGAINPLVTPSTNVFTCYTSVYPSKSAVHGFLYTWTSNGCFYYIIKSHDNICSNSVLHNLLGKHKGKQDIQEGNTQETKPMLQHSSLRAYFSAKKRKNKCSVYQMGIKQFCH